MQLGAQGHDAAVDLGADAGVAHLAVHRIGEVDRRGPARQRDEVSLGREAEHLVLEHLELGVLEELLRPRGVLEDVEELAQPAVLLAVLAALALLVDPVRRHAELGHVVHLAGADLHLDALPLGSDHAGVERAVVVGLGRRDVVLEAAGDDRILGVDDAEALVALLGRLDDDAERHDVRQLLEADVLALHLEPDRVGGLLAARHPGGEPALGQGLPELLDDPGHQIAAALPEEPQPRNDAVARILGKLAEGQVLQLVAHRLDADALGQGRIDLHGLERDAAALHRIGDVVERAHVVQPVGELHQEDADVLRHGEHQLAEILRLLGVIGLQLEAIELGDAVDQAADLLAEEILDPFQGGIGVFDGVVEQCRDDGGAVQLHAGQDAGDFQGVGEIRIARRPGLRSVRLHREHIGAVERRFLGVRIVSLDALDQLVLADHRMQPRNPPADPGRRCGRGRRRLEARRPTPRAWARPLPRRSARQSPPRRLPRPRSKPRPHPRARYRR